MEQGWSVKAMQRIIMSSAVYQQVSAGHDSATRGSRQVNSPDNARIKALARKSADNHSLSPSEGAPFPRRRLEAEEIRDTLLALSGELDRAPGSGHPFPAENTSFTQHTPFKAVYDTKKRSVYLMTQRIQRHPFLALFDGPDSNASTAERSSSTVPTQSLYFLNDPFFHARAESFAKRLLARPEAERISLAHRLCFQREPTALEKSQGAEFLQAYRVESSDLPENKQELALWSAYARTLLASNELLYLD
jgi:hypothetical protein